MASKPPVTPGLVTEALNQLPERIHVGAYPIRIKIFEPGDRAARSVWGQFDAQAQTIWISREFPSLTFMGMIFTHELLHAIWWAQSLNEDGENEERVVTQLATGITQVYRDNPWLLDWIAMTYRFDRVPPRFSFDEAVDLVAVLGNKKPPKAPRKAAAAKKASPAKPKSKAQKKPKMGFLSAKKSPAAKAC